MPPKKPKPALVVTPQELERRIYLVRDQRVMLDSDLAELYGVPTKVLNQAVERNIERFPDDFAYLLTAEEVAALRSQIVTSNVGRGGRRTRPRVFTEHGVAMVSGVLRSPTAVAVNIEIIRAFVRLRRLVVTPAELVAQVRQLAETVEVHDEQIRGVIDVLTDLANPPAEPPNRRIGFHPPDPAPDTPP